jgi:hypothetical protein
MVRLGLCGFALLLPQIAWGDAASDAAQLDDFYAKREDAAAAKQGDAAVDAALKASPNDYGILWRAARWKWWAADGSSGELKKRLGKEAWNIGEQAVKANPSGVEGQHFTAVAIGAYSQAVGILKALSEGLEGKFNEHLDAAIKTDPSFLNCGPLIAKGRYYYELPWPKRSLSKSVDMLGKAISTCPKNIRAYVYLAETELKDGDAKKAQETLAKAPSEGTYDVPEAHRALEMEKKVQAAVSEELK